MRVARKTVLVVGEGDDECAVSHHFRAIYNARGCGTSVKIRNAHGRGPENIVRAAIRSDGSFDKKVVVLDTDITWDPRVVAQAKKHRIQMIGSEPCLDGMILRVLNEAVPDTSPACKAALQRILPRGLCDRRTLELHLTREVLNEARGRIAVLNELLTIFEGR